MKNVRQVLSPAQALTCTDTGWCVDANTVPFRREKALYVFITTLD